MRGRENFSEFYRKHTLAAWKDRVEPNKAEYFLFEKYLTDTSKKVMEAGTGGGILSFYLEDQGFGDICAFDIIPEMIQAASERSLNRNSRIKFELIDAVHLKNYSNDQFDYIINMGQIFCMIPKDKLQVTLNEAYRVAKPNGLMLCSFMDWERRWYNPLVSMLINIHRLFTGQKMAKYYLPHLKLQGKFNFRYFFSKDCICFWPKAGSIIERLEKTGFKVEKLYKEEQITGNKGTAFYIVCRK